MTQLVHLFFELLLVLDQDGLVDVVLCDVTKNQIAWIRQTPAGTFTETPLSAVVLAPAHVTPADVDLDGDIDLLVAEMGQIRSSNEKIGTRHSARKSRG